MEHGRHNAFHGVAMACEKGAKASKYPRREVERRQPAIRLAKQRRSRAEVGLWPDQSLVQAHRVCSLGRWCWGLPRNDLAPFPPGLTPLPDEGMDPAGRSRGQYGFN